ncbi:hypothetical protein [Nonomuraea sp. B19D2]|uniref:hypothetical protein n=1 Tax=Nonomuraea sp. B19D2 TaxID=3159561 RepID=UPI0032DBDC94
MIADVAPLGSHGDDLNRLQGASSSLDVATEAKNGQTGTNEAVSHVRTAGNLSDDMTASEDHVRVAQAEADKGGVAAAVSGTATMLLVVLKVVWRLYVIAALISLLIAIARYFAFGPAVGSVGTRSYIAYLREKMRTALAGIKKNIRHNPVAALKHAKALLSAGARRNVGTVTYITGLASIPAFVTAGLAVPWDNNEEARDLTEQSLRQTEEGRAALAYARDHNITVTYRNGLSSDDLRSRYYPNTNMLILGAEGFGSWERPHDLAEDFIRHIDVAKGNDGRFTEDEQSRDAAWYRLHYARPDADTYDGRGINPDKFNWPYAQINQLFDFS